MAWFVLAWFGVALVCSFTHVGDPHRRLVRFKRVHLAAGASTTVNFNATAATFKQVLPSGDVVVAPGRYRVQLTNGVDQTVDHQLVLSGNTTVLESFPTLA
jgi:hypothetical protein